MKQESGCRDGTSVAVVITTFNDHQFLSDAIESGLAQTVAPSEIIVVDDGSDDDPTDLVSRFPGVRLIRQANAGLAGARNTGLGAASSDMILFLDADDRLLPNAVSEGLACFEHSPAAAFVYGGYRVVDHGGTPSGPDQFLAVGEQPYLDLLGGNLIAMHAAVLYRTALLKEIGGFDPTLRRCEDYELYLRIAANHAIGCHPRAVAEYRWHQANMSHAHGAMLRSALGVLARFPPRTAAERSAARRGRDYWKTYYGRAIVGEIRRELGAGRVRTVFSLAADLSAASSARILGAGLRKIVRRAKYKLLPRNGEWPPRLGHVRLGDLGSTRPVSASFGFDRGLPIDRYYIEAFLARHRDAIQGTVLEIGDDEYSRRYGADRISRQEVLHVHAGNPAATIVGDLTDPALLAANDFDCLVLTQTLHLIYDFRAAIGHMHNALKPGGVLLLTVPGITPVDRDEWGAGWYWSFTRAAIERLFGEAFGPSEISVEQFGNVFAATAFLQGLALEEVDRNKLDVADEAFPVIVAVRARKAA